MWSEFRSNMVPCSCAHVGPHAHAFKWPLIDALASATSVHGNVRQVNFSTPQDTEYMKYKHELPPRAECASASERPTSAALARLRAVTCAHAMYKSRVVRESSRVCKSRRSLGGRTHTTCHTKHAARMQPKCQRGVMRMSRTCHVHY